MANTGDRLLDIRKVFGPQPEGNIHEGNQYGHLDERPDHGRKGHTGLYAENRNGNRNRQLEIIGCRREAQRGGLFVSGPGLHGQEERDHEHGQKIDGQGQGDTQHVKWQLDDILAFQREHDQNGKNDSLFLFSMTCGSFEYLLMGGAVGPVAVTLGYRIDSMAAYKQTAAIFELNLG